MHNGTIRSFQSIKRELVLAVSPELYTHIKGTTDSEIMFYLALTFGMTENVAAGVARMVGLVEQVGRKLGIDNPMQMSLGISDGRCLYAFRYSSEGESRTLFHSKNIEAIKDIAPEAQPLAQNARAIVSEPLSDLAEIWVPVPESSFVTVKAGDVRIQSFEPELL